MKFKIRKGDTVEIMSGNAKDKGKRGEVIRVISSDRRIVVQGINMRKKHQGQVQTQGRTMTPGIIELEGSIDISNVMLVCPKCEDLVRVGYHREDGISLRVCRSCNGLID